MITVQAALIPPGWTGMRLGYGRLGVAALDAAPAGPGFRIGLSVLGGDPLGSTAPALTWQDIDVAQLCNASYKRGCRLDGVRITTETGTMSVTWRDAGDPDTFPGLNAGTPIRLLDDDLGTLFTGRFYDAVTLAAKPPAHTFTTWTIADAVREDNQTTAGPFITDLGYTDAQRANQIVNGITIDPATGTNPLAALVVAPTSNVANIADQLDRTAASGHGLWYVDAAGLHHYQRYRVEAIAAAVYSDVSEPSYHDLAARWGTAGIVNIVTIRNDVINPTNPTEDTTNTTTYSDPTSAATYGARATEMETNIKPTGLAPLGARYLSIDPAATASTFTLRTKPATLHEIGTAIDVQYHGKQMPSRILGLDVDIDPDIERGTRWAITYRLAPRPTA